MLTSSSGLENHFLGVLTDPPTRFRSVFNRILPPASWGTTTEHPQENAHTFPGCKGMGSAVSVRRQQWCQSLCTLLVWVNDLTIELGPAYLVAVIAHHIPYLMSRSGTSWIYGLIQELGPVFLVAFISHHTPNLTLCYGPSWINVGVSAYHCVFV